MGFPDKMYYPQQHSVVPKKLKLGQPDDMYENESKQVAEAVMQMPDSTRPMQRKSQTFKGEELKMKPIAGMTAPKLQRKVTSAPGGQFSLTSFNLLQTAMRYYQRMEKPLQLAVGKPVANHFSPRNIKSQYWRSDPEAIAGLVLVYNKMRNDGTWRYVKKISSASARVSFNFYPKGGHGHFREQLSKHDYTSWTG